MDTMLDNWKSKLKEVLHNWMSRLLEVRNIDYNLVDFWQNCCDSGKTMFQAPRREYLFSILVFQFFSHVIMVRSDDELFDKLVQVLEHSMEHYYMIPENYDKEFHKMEMLMRFHK